MDKEKEKKDILILYTGGTIGSIKVNDKDGNGVILLPSKAKEAGYEIDPSKMVLIDAFKRKYPDDNRISKLKGEIVMEVLSENMTLNAWDKLANYLKTINFEDYRGIIITHGTDSLGYTANVLSILLSNVKIPVMLVSSNFVPDIIDKANGPANLKGALDFIDQVSLPGVYVVYENNGITKVIYGSRVTQCAPIFDDFNGICSLENNTPYFLSFKDGNYEIKDKKLEESILNKDRSNPNLLDELKSLRARILKINPYVGLDYSELNIKNCDAILHTLYHSGTFCSDLSIGEKGATPEEFSINTFAKRCNKPLYFGPIYGSSDRDLYEGSAKINREHFLMNTSEEAAYAKLVVAYSLYEDNEEKIKELLFNDINFEYIDEARSLIKK